MINYKHFLICLAPLFPASGNAMGRFAPNAADRPNIVFFLADDLGWMDSEPYGSKYYHTPNISKLAKQGMLFTDAYAASPLCTPTRASLMTGKYPHRINITLPAAHLPVDQEMEVLPQEDAAFKKVVEPNSFRHLADDEYTIGMAFKDAGYATGFIGKWHLGHAPEHWSSNYGFDFNLGGGPEPLPPSYFSPYGIKNLPDGPVGEYLTDRLAQEADRFIRGHQKEPFFLFYAHYAVHSPFEGKPELVSEYESKSDPRGEQRLPTMAAMVESLDQALGALFQTLEKTGVADHTIIVFFSDNGGNMYDVDPETNIPPTSNAPLRNGKGNIHEGGVRVPLIVKWPGVVAPGVSSAVVSSIDLYPTLLEMAGIAPNPKQTLDGESIVPVLTGTGELKRDAVFCHFPHYIAATKAIPATSVRKEKWKLIRFYGEGPDREPLSRLYDLSEDIGEIHDVAEQHPGTCRDLEALIDCNLNETGAIIPCLNPRFDPAAYDAIAVPRIPRWMASGTCSLECAPDGLTVQSYGENPEIVLSQVEGVSGVQRVVIRMRSNSSGKARLFWNERREIIFGGRYAQWFEPVHDGKSHEYTIDFETTCPVNAFQVWPSRSIGTMTIENVQYFNSKDQRIGSWPTRR